MKKHALFIIKQGNWIESIFSSIPLCMIFIISNQIVVAGVVYIFILWLFRTFSFRYMRINYKSIVGFRYTRPFRKTYRYLYSDINQIYISSPGRRGWKIEFRFNDGDLFSSRVPDNIEFISRHFVDRRVPIQTDSSYLRKIITEHLATLQIDPRKQIASRKARELARKAKLAKLRGGQ